MQQVYSASMTMPLILAADNLTAAQAQADQLTTGSTAATALAAALAAGLISGLALAVIPSHFETILHLRLLHPALIWIALQTLYHGVIVLNSAPVSSAAASLPFDVSSPACPSLA